VARSTRAQRRARRESQDEGAAQPVRPQAAPAPVRPAEVTTDSHAGRPARLPAASRRRLPFSGIRQFLLESWGELKKVEWPSQPHLVQGVVVVLVACVVVGVYLYAADQVFKRLVEHVFLR